MSAEGDDYPFLKKSVMQHFNNHQTATSTTRSTPGVLTQTNSDRLALTQQNLYDGDDELSEMQPEMPAPHQATTPEDLSTQEATPITASLSKTVTGPQEPVTHTDDNSDDNATQAQHAPTPLTSTDNNVQQLILVTDPICAGETDGMCTLRSGDHRKVVSHIFGRNKRSTHQIPDNCWIKYCRKHYQRQKYRRPEDWPDTQLQIVDAQLDMMENWGGISSWTIAIRKRERMELDKENALLAQYGTLPEGMELKCRERFLLPYLGSRKTFKDVRDLIDIINLECDNHKGEKAWKDLPSFELLPEIDERRNPRPRRGANRRMVGQNHLRGSGPSTFRLSELDGQLTKIPAKPSTKAVDGPRSVSDPTATTSARVTGAYAPVSPPEANEGTEGEQTKTETNSPNLRKRTSSETDSDDDSIIAEILRPVKRVRRRSI
ncbi:MAG: hypothetical protein LQ350_003751 [Teloschistes chrysophthalmus]|nr:MAG: hypothetical protein LQ350_003751 [Niorma chrysophthalma]